MIIRLFELTIFMSIYSYGIPVSKGQLKLENLNGNIQGVNTQQLFQENPPERQKYHQWLQYPLLQQQQQQQQQLQQQQQQQQQLQQQQQQQQLQQQLQQYPQPFQFQSMQTPMMQIHPNEQQPQRSSIIDTQPSIYPVIHQTPSFYMDNKNLLNGDEYERIWSEMSLLWKQMSDRLEDDWQDFWTKLTVVVQSYLQQFSRHISEAMGVAVHHNQQQQTFRHAQVIRGIQTGIRNLFDVQENRTFNSRPLKKQTSNEARMTNNN